MIEKKTFVEDGTYIGKILTGNYSESLKTSLVQILSATKSFEETGTMVIPYVSAWKEAGKVIWYELVGQKLITILNCPPAEVAKAFLESVIDRRAYHYVEFDEKIREEIIPRQQLSGHREGLREEGKQRGVVEAVYKLSLPEDKIIWLKDWALIKTFETDGINLSIGTLTDVTKEMDHKELLERIGYFDELTKLPKRNILYRILEINIGQLQRGHLKNFVFLMMDIDHFKSVNDNYGHQAGDYILSVIAEVMTSIKRKEDEIGRYAGEEFYAITHGNIESGRRFAERLRKKIEKTTFEYESHKIAITISIGVAEARSLEELNEEKLIMTADKRLYTAKQRGRNLVVWHD